MGDWLERNRGYAVVIRINLAFWLKRPDSAPLEIMRPDSTPAPSPPPSMDAAYTIAKDRLSQPLPAVNRSIKAALHGRVVRAWSAWENPHSLT